LIAEPSGTSDTILSFPPDELTILLAYHRRVSVEDLHHTALADRPAVRRSIELLGQPGSRHQVPTPALLLDLDAFEANLRHVADAAAVAGVALRPHAKTHKCADLARRQLAAGAVGICVAKLGEAEALAAEGIGDILLTSPLVGPVAARRVADLVASGTSMTVAVDRPGAVADLAAAASGVRSPIPVIVDLDVGLHRSGVPTPADAVRLAEAIAAQPTLILRGVQGYGGHWQHVPGVADRRAAVAEGMTRLTAVVDALTGRGFDVPVRTGGGTGTLDIDLELGVLTELQPGSYIAMDVQYGEVSGLSALRQALFVQATVTADHYPEWVTVDAGLKALATDAGPPGSLLGDYDWFGDEQGRIRVTGSDRPRVGDRVELVPPHCDPTVDRYDLLHVVRGDVLVDLWPVHARGRSQ
jgi:D-serine deaminase-like pyridoxal phosphate-dependent protein